MSNRSRISLIALIETVLVLLHGSTAHADVIEHPAFANWSKFPVGTQVTIKSTTTMKGKLTANVTTTTTLAKKDAKAVVIRKAFKVEGQPEPHPDDFVETTIKRDFPVLPGADASKIGKPAGRPMDKSEQVELLGKKYETEVYESRGSTEAGPMTTKTWTSLEIPGQVVKSVSEVKAVEKFTVDEVVSIKIPGM
jgi:hypothetical protein